MLKRYAPGLIVVALVAIGFLSQWAIATRAFEKLEADQVAQDAQRVRIALDYEVRLLSGYGATNSIWDSSYAHVRDGDRAAFAADFPPADVRTVFDLDGVVGVGPDGTPRVGGLVSGSTFAPLPADLAVPATLARLFDPRAAAGTGRCGVVTSAANPFLYCGFPSYPGDSGGAPAGGLVYLKALDAANLTALGQQMDLPVTLATVSPAGAGTLRLTSALGELRVGTRVLRPDRIAVDVALTAADGSVVVVSGERDRAIHRTATGTALRMLLLMALAAAVLLTAMAVLVRRGIRQQVQPLRRNAEAIVASGDRSLRTNITERGEIGALARAIDTMLDAMAEHDVRQHDAGRTREKQLRTTYAERRLADQDSRRRTQDMIDETVGSVIAELDQVVEQTGVVRSAADTIDERVTATDSVTAETVQRAAQADQAIAELEQSLRRVDGIAKLINELAAQTRLLALNATIEAARAGSAGRGFSVVASEVKTLATNTASSSGEITETVHALQQRAATMAAVISGMSNGIKAIDASTSKVREVSREQHVVVQRLNDYLAAAAERVRTMTQITRQLELRGGLPRVPARGSSSMRVRGTDHEIQLLDLSESGLRCLIAPGVAVAAGDRVEVTVPIDDGPALTLTAVVAHRTADELGTEIGLQFTDLTEAASDELHRQVIAALQHS